MKKLPNIKYCQKNKSNHSSCSHLATQIVTLVSEVSQRIEYRCDSCKGGTTKMKVQSIEPFNQDENIRAVNSFLRLLIGKSIKSKAHTAKALQVQYMKDNCGVMCFQPITKKYKYVYYNQITAIL